MLGGLDHLIIACADPDEAAGELEQRLGLRATGGGRHAAHGTFNRLVWLGDSYLELMGVFDRALATDSWLGRPVSRMLDEGPAAMAGMALASDDLATDVERLRAQGSPIGEPTAGERLRADGDVVRWSSARPPGIDAELGLLFLIEHDTGAAEWRPADRAARAEEVHPLGTPVRLALVEAPVSDIRAATMRLHRDFGVAFRPSLAGSGARDGALGSQTLRLVRRAAGSLPMILLRGGRQRREVEMLGVRFVLEPSAAVASSWADAR